MRLSELKKGDMATIVKIDSDSMIKERLLSFGVAKGSQLSVEEYSIANKTIEIRVDNTLIGLRSDEALYIVVERIDG